MLRPGVEIIQKHGGLHQFNGWNNIILTDSEASKYLACQSLEKSLKKGWFSSHHSMDLNILTLNQQFQFKRFRK